MLGEGTRVFVFSHCKLNAESNVKTKREDRCVETKQNQKDILILLC